MWNIRSRTYMGREDGELRFALFKFTVPIKLSGDVHWTVRYARNNTCHSQSHHHILVLKPWIWMRSHRVIVE